MHMHRLVYADLADLTSFLFEDPVVNCRCEAALETSQSLWAHGHCQALQADEATVSERSFLALVRPCRITRGTHQHVSMTRFVGVVRKAFEKSIHTDSWGSALPPVDPSPQEGAFSCACLFIYIYIHISNIYIYI